MARREWVKEGQTPLAVYRQHTLFSRKIMPNIPLPAVPIAAPSRPLWLAAATPVVYDSHASGNFFLFKYVSALKRPQSGRAIKTNKIAFWFVLRCSRLSFTVSKFNQIILQAYNNRTATSKVFSFPPNFKQIGWKWKNFASSSPVIICLQNYLIKV